MIYLISNSKASRVKNLQLSEIKYSAFSLNLKNYDSLLITSKHSAFALLKNRVFLDEELREKLKIFAIGEKSADFFLKLGFKNVFVSEKKGGKDFAEEILPFLRAKRNLYLKAKKSAFAMEEFFAKNKVKCDFLQAYENLPLKLAYEEKPEENSILIFTSPSNVENFLKNFGWLPSYKAIAIGETTAKALTKYGKVLISEDKNIDSCIKLAKKISLESQK